MNVRDEIVSDRNFSISKSCVFLSKFSASVYGIFKISVFPSLVYLKKVNKSWRMFAKDRWFESLSVLPTHIC